MTQNRFILFAALCFVLLVFVYVKKEGAKDDYLAGKKELLAFEKEAEELASLKNKYKDKKVAARLISSLEKIKTPSKDLTKSDTRVLEFEDLDLRVLNRLIKKIQNTTLIISKFEIIRESDTSTKLRVEIKK